MRTTLLNQEVTKPQRLKALRQLGDNKQQLNFYGIKFFPLFISCTTNVTNQKKYPQ